MGANPAFSAKLTKPGPQPILSFTARGGGEYRDWGSAGVSSSIGVRFRLLCPARTQPMSGRMAVHRPNEGQA